MVAGEWQSRFAAMLRDYDPFDSVQTLKTLVTERQVITTWKDLRDWIEPFKDTGCFRGERDATWGLISSLDREATREISVEDSGVQITSQEQLSLEENERQLLLDFQRGASLHHSPLPALSHTVDWLALMQHYGTPTRLLDWSRSPYVALYFALEKRFDEDSALWAINIEWLRGRSLELLRANRLDCPDGRDFLGFAQYIAEIILLSDSPLTIVPADPMQLNARMLAQQGQLLCNVGRYTGFSNVLLGMLMHTTPEANQVISRAILKRDNRVTFLKELQDMNIHRASLFPGIDGFARSLGVGLELRISRQKEMRKAQMLTEMTARRARKKKPC